MYTLAIDTSTNLGSLALFHREGDSTEVMADTSWSREKSHSEVVTFHTEQMLKAANISIDQLTSLCVDIGPGSFTGLRVGVNLARALGYANQIPIMTCSSLRVLAEQALDESLPVLCMINAFKNQLFVAAFERSGSETNTILEPQAMTLEALEAWARQEFWCLGDGYSIYASHFSNSFKSLLHRLPEAKDFPQAIDLGRVCLQETAKNPPLGWSQIKPLYIRASEAEEKLRGGLLKPLPKI